MIKELLTVYCSHYVGVLYILIIAAYRGYFVVSISEYENVYMMNSGIEDSHDLQCMQHFIVMEITFYVEKSMLSISYFM